MDRVSIKRRKAKRRKPEFNFVLTGGNPFERPIIDCYLGIKSYRIRREFVVLLLTLGYQIQKDDYSKSIDIKDFGRPESRLMKSIDNRTERFRIPHPIMNLSSSVAYCDEIKADWNAIESDRQRRDFLYSLLMVGFQVYRQRLVPNMEARIPVRKIAEVALQPKPDRPVEKETLPATARSLDTPPEKATIKSIPQGFLNSLGGLVLPPGVE